MSLKKYTGSVAISLVIANMIGTGVFTSLGYQVGPIPSGFSILLLWMLGGVIAFCGAVSYAEIGTIFKRSGGEYNYLTEIYHPSLGFASGWISLFAGFAAPICAVSIAIGSYFSPVLGVESEMGMKAISAGAIILMSAVHITGVKTGGIIQNILTAIKLLLIVGFIIAPFVMPGFEPGPVSFTPRSEDWDLILSAPFGIALVYVYYSYSGWNASVYIAGNLENPKKTLPFSLIVGTTVVTILYVLLNGMFLYASDFESLAGKEEIGNIVAVNLFGEDIGKLFSGLFSLALISSLSAMVIAGPRVTEVMGEDYKAIKGLTKENKKGAPYLTITLQAIIALILLFTSTFSEILQYIGVGLSLFATLTVLGVFITRYKKPNIERTFKTWGYPVTPALFIIANLAMISFVVYSQPMIGLASLGTIAAGFGVWYLVKEA